MSTKRMQADTVRRHTFSEGTSSSQYTENKSKQEAVVSSIFLHSNKTFRRQQNNNKSPFPAPHTHARNVPVSYPNKKPPIAAINVK